MEILIQKYNKCRMQIIILKRQRGFPVFEEECRSIHEVEDDDKDVQQRRFHIGKSQVIHSRNGIVKCKIASLVKEREREIKCGCGEIKGHLFFSERILRCVAIKVEVVNTFAGFFHVLRKSFLHFSSSTVPPPIYPCVCSPRRSA